MQISAAILEKPILFNIIKTMHYTLTKMMTMAMLSRSVVRINAIRKC